MLFRDRPNHPLRIPRIDRIPQEHKAHRPLQCSNKRRHSCAQKRFLAQWTDIERVAGRNRSHWPQQTPSCRSNNNSLDPHPRNIGRRCDWVYSYYPHNKTRCAPPCLLGRTDRYWVHIRRPFDFPKQSLRIYIPEDIAQARPGSGLRHEYRMAGSCCIRERSDKAPCCIAETFGIDHITRPFEEALGKSFPVPSPDTENREDNCWFVLASIVDCNNCCLHRSHKPNLRSP